MIVVAGVLWGLAAAIGLAIVLVGGLVAQHAPTQQSRCDGDVAEQMQEARRTERQQVAGVGYRADGGRVVMTMGPDGRWSLFYERSGQGCILANGGGWRWSTMARGRNL